MCAGLGCYVCVCVGVYVAVCVLVCVGVYVDVCVCVLVSALFGQLVIGLRLRQQKCAGRSLSNVDIFRGFAA